VSDLRFLLLEILELLKNVTTILITHIIHSFTVEHNNFM